MIELIKYEEVEGIKPATVAKANTLRKKLLDVLEGDQVYKILGLKTKVMTYDRKYKSVTPHTEVLYQRETEKSLSELSSAQIGYFGNLTNIRNVSNLDDVLPSFNVVDDPLDANNKMLFMATSEKDSLGRIRMTKYAVIFRRYTEEENAEYQARLEAQAAEDLGVGYTSDILSMATMAW